MNNNNGYGMGGGTTIIEDRGCKLYKCIYSVWKQIVNYCQ